MKNGKSNIKTWTQIKDEQFGKKGTPRRDHLDREFERLENIKIENWIDD